MMRRFSLLVLPFLLMACADREPTAPDITPAFDEGGNSGCATVHFVYSGSLPFWQARPVAGDLEGTLQLHFAPGPTFAGVTMKNGGTAEWNITGGILGPLQFTTEFDNKNFITDRPGSPLYLFENIGTHRALQGVQKANLHYKGTYDALAGYAEHDYTGVICP